MQIVISKRAAQIYVSSLGTRQPINWDWKDKMTQIQGMTLDVETEHLFLDQFNTGPVPGVSDQGLRIMTHVVVEVIDDARPGRQKCRHCGKDSKQDMLDCCPHCNDCGHLEKWTVAYIKRWNPCSAKEVDNGS